MNFIENESPQKLRGGYYTPVDLASFLVRWVAEINPSEILEPSCGDGNFFEAVAKTTFANKAQLTGFELDRNEAAKARRRVRDLKVQATIHAQDFLSWALPRFGGGECFDAVIGNPPFVRYPISA